MLHRTVCVCSMLIIVICFHSGVLLCVLQRRREHREEKQSRHER